VLCEVVPKVDPQVLAGRGTLDLDRVAELGREHVGARKYLQQVEEPLGRAGGFAAGRVGCFVGCHSDSLRPLYVRSTYRSCSAGDALAVSHSCMGSGVECALNVRDEGAEPGSYPSQSIDNLRPHVMVRNERVVRDLGSHPLHRTLPTRSRRIQTPTTPRIMKSRFGRAVAAWHWCATPARSCAACAQALPTASRGRGARSGSIRRPPGVARPGAPGSSLNHASRSSWSSHSVSVASDLQST